MKRMAPTIDITKKISEDQLEIKKNSSPGTINFNKINLGVNGQVEFDIKKLEDLFNKDNKILGNVCEKNRNELNGLMVPFDFESCSQENLQGSFAQLGRSKDYPKSKITEKSREEFEAEDAFEKKLVCNFFYSKKRRMGLKSKIPTPLYFTKDNFYYRRTDGYHHYLTDIENQNEFEISLQVCAHDLGILLKQGIAYHELISVFHGTTTNASLKENSCNVITVKDNAIKQKENIARFYTLFPHIVGAYARAEVDGKVAIRNNGWRI